MKLSRNWTQDLLASWHLFSPLEQPLLKVYLFKYEQLTILWFQVANLGLFSKSRNRVCNGYEKQPKVRLARHLRFTLHLIHATWFIPTGLLELGNSVGSTTDHCKLQPIRHGKGLSTMREESAGITMDSVSIHLYTQELAWARAFYP